MDNNRIIPKRLYTWSTTRHLLSNCSLAFSDLSIIQGA